MLMKAPAASRLGVFWLLANCFCLIWVSLYARKVLSEAVHYGEQRRGLS